MDYLRVEGNPGLVRDKNTGAILSINRKNIEEARAQKAARKEEEQKIVNLENRMSAIEYKVDEVLNLLSKIAEK